MPETEYRLDDKYTEGIWYDTLNGDYAEIQEASSGDEPNSQSASETLVELVNPETGEVYWDVPVSEWVESEQSDFRQVSEEAVEDPVAVVNRAIRLLSRNNINELASVPFQEEIDLRYAREQVEIKEQ